MYPSSSPPILVTHNILFILSIYMTQNLGQMDIQNLEAKWMQQHPNSMAWGDDCDDAYEEEEERNEQRTNNTSNENNTGPSPIHMELFYNDQ